jgi:formate hydrogenlyase subunit 3/multisubunit Na+/H+ antiporter MnhD subunit
MNALVLPGPLFFFAALLLLGALAYALNRWTLLAGGIAASGCLLLAWIALRRLGSEAPILPAQDVDLLGQGVRITRSFELLGRTWALTESSLAGLSLILALSGFCFFFSLPTPHGWAFYPFGLATLSALTLALTAQQLVYALLFIWLAGCLVVFVLAGGRPGETTAALRTLVFVSFGVMPLLLLPRYLTPDPAGYAGMVDATAPLGAANAGQLPTLLMTAGIAILLLMVPFHGQLVAMGAHSAPMALPFTLTVMPTVVLHTCFRLWEAHPNLLTGQFLFDVCRWTGIAAVVLGGLGALGQRQWGALVGYVTLVDWGASLMALGLGTRAGAEQMAQMLVWRAFSLLLVGTGWGALFKAAGRRDELERCAEPVRRHPLSVLALVLGLLSLAGFPLTPGGFGRWSLLDPAVLAQPLADWPATTQVLILAGAAASLGTAIALGTCLGRRTTTHLGESDDKEPAETRDPVDQKWRGRRLEALLNAGMSVLALWLIGTFVLRPGFWLALARRLVGGQVFPGG